MKALPGAATAALHKLSGLFIEDRLFALAIALCIGAVAAAVHFSNVDRGAAGLAFFAALIAILLASVLRAARSPRPGA
jgi:hypothetical protein